MKKHIMIVMGLVCIAMLFAGCGKDDAPETGITTMATEATIPEKPTESTNLPTEPTAQPTVPSTQPAVPSETTQPVVPSETTQPVEPPAPTLPEYVPGSIILEDQDTDDYEYERKYRITYYRIWSEFSDLLDEDQKKDYNTWFYERVENGSFREEMALAAMVKRYNIPRERFDEAVEAFIANNLESHSNMSQEEYEVPNADIIYTFDNEIINHYYRYE